MSRLHHIALASLVFFGCGSSSPVTPLPASSTRTGSEEKLRQSSCTPAPEGAEETPFALENPYGTLHGTLTVPAGCTSIPVVLFVAGSGPTDRDGNQPGLKAQPTKLLADGLAQRGIASLRYDKAGIGESAKAAPKAERDLRFETYSSDVARLVRALRADRRFVKVIVAGHSEGSLLGLIAAREEAVDSFVSLAGAGRPIQTVLREQLTNNIADSSLLEQALGILSELEAGRTTPDVPSTLASLFRPAIQPYLISWMKHDPASEMAALGARALIVQGTTDIQVKVEDAEVLHRAKPDAELAIIQGMNHVLKDAEGDAAAQRASYTSADQPLTRGLVERLATFIDGTK